jgi:CDP-diacylglycerol pyrophosphatase
MPLRLLLAALLALIALAPASRAADPDALWKIISEKCLPNEREYGLPAPCAVVDLHDGAEKGYVVLKDIVGDTQYLVMPTAKIIGIDDPAVLAANAPNYFADAWRERHFTIDAAKAALPRNALSLAINSAYGRTQYQFHIHIDCVRADVRDAVQRQLTSIGDNWALLAEPLLGHPYRAMRVTGDDLDGFDPFRRLADGVPGAREAMGNQTLVVLGATLPDGKPGFVILTDRTNAATGDRASGEELQDHSCAIAHQ